MTLAAGARLGPYEIVAPLGAGGMGEVYRARDTRLKREVAIKVLPDACASDGDRLARFRREAELLATLNHPNIGAVYGLEQSKSGNAIVLELVEGPTLAERISQGPIPLDEALPIAKQIVGALEAAHERGIIHRDLKPANIKLTAAGTVKVLDFGLAKSSGEYSQTNTSMSPTITSPAMTMSGVILGTAAYMSPEQARGKPVDKRTDIWAFGCVLYEMLTGKRAFEGDDVTETIAAIVRGEPDWNRLPPLPPIHRLLRRLLHKDAGDRLADIADVRFELNEAAEIEGAPALSSGVSRGSRKKDLLSNARVAWAVAGLFAIAVSMALLFFSRKQIEPPQKFAFEISAPSASTPLQFTLSPTGTHLVTLSGVSSLRASLWLRPLDRVAGELLKGTEGASRPFFSSDGRSIGYFSGGKLKTIDMQGGAQRTLTDALRPQGGTWSGDTIIYAPDDSGPLFRINASGDGPIQVTDLDKSRLETGHWHPVFSEDGRHFLYVARSNTPENSAVYLATLDSKERTQLVSSSTKAMFAGPNHILFARDNALMAQQFDPLRGTVLGNPFQVAEPIGYNPLLGDAGFSASFTGIVAHRGGLRTDNPVTALTWFDRTGRPLGTAGTPGPYRNPSLSPNGNHIAVERANDARGDSVDLWLIDTGRHVSSRFTFAEPGSFHQAPLWSPDGTRIAWASSGGRGSQRTLFQKLVNGTDKDEKVRDLPGSAVIDDWAPSTGILFHDGSGLSGTAGIRVLPLDGGEIRSLSGDVRSILTHARVSPDGQWIAFASSDAGPPEIYLQNFPTPTERIQISSAGGIQPVWRPDGKELFFIAPDGKMMAVPLQLSKSAVAGSPVVLFATRMEGGGTQSPGIWHQYDVSPDGQRFLINSLIEQEEAKRELPITVLVNWNAGLGK